MAESTSRRSDWLPQRARWDFPRWSFKAAEKKFSFLPYSNKSFIDQSFSTSSPSIKTQKKNLANIQPSWPHIWSITHIYCFFFFWQIYNLSSRNLCTSFVLPILRLTLLRLRRCCVELHYGIHCFSDGIPRLRGKHQPRLKDNLGVIVRLSQLESLLAGIGFGSARISSHKSRCQGLCSEF